MTSDIAWFVSIWYYGNYIIADYCTSDIHPTFIRHISDIKAGFLCQIWVQIECLDRPKWAYIGGWVEAYREQTDQFSGELEGLWRTYWEFGRTKVTNSLENWRACKEDSRRVWRVKGEFKLLKVSDYDGSMSDYVVWMSNLCRVMKNWNYNKALIHRGLYKKQCQMSNGYVKIEGIMCHMSIIQIPLDDESTFFIMRIWVVWGVMR